LPNREKCRGQRQVKGPGDTVLDLRMRSPQRRSSANVHAVAWTNVSLLLAYPASQGALVTIRLLWALKTTEPPQRAVILLSSPKDQPRRPSHERSPGVTVPALPPAPRNGMQAAPLTLDVAGTLL
jgi:hypothetical protein